MMHEVACDYRASSARANIDAAVAGGVARRWGQPYRVIQRKIVLHQHGPPCFDHGEAVHPPHIAVRRAASSGGRLPELVFSAVEHILRPRESRHPAAVNKPRIPAAMIEM